MSRRVEKTKEIVRYGRDYNLNIFFKALIIPISYCFGFYIQFMDYNEQTYLHSLLSYCKYIVSIMHQN